MKKQIFFAVLSVVVLSANTSLAQEYQSKFIKKQVKAPLLPSEWVDTDSLTRSVSGVKLTVDAFNAEVVQFKTEFYSYKTHGKVRETLEMKDVLQACGGDEREVYTNTASCIERFLTQRDGKKPIVISFEKIAGTVETDRIRKRNKACVESQLAEVAQVAGRYSNVLNQDHRLKKVELHFVDNEVGSVKDEELSYGPSLEDRKLLFWTKRTLGFVVVRNSKGECVTTPADQLEKEFAALIVEPAPEFKESPDTFKPTAEEFLKQVAPVRPSPVAQGNNALGSVKADERAPVVKAEDRGEVRASDAK